MFVFWYDHKACLSCRVALRSFRGSEHPDSDFFSLRHFHDAGRSFNELSRQLLVYCVRGSASRHVFEIAQSGIDKIANDPEFDPQSAIELNTTTHVDNKKNNAAWRDLVRTAPKS